MRSLTAALDEPIPLRAGQLFWGSLHAKFIVFIAFLQIAVLAAVTVVMEGHQRSAIIEQIRLQALSIGTRLAILSEGYPLRDNDSTLEQADAENRVKALR